MCKQQAAPGKTYCEKHLLVAKGQRDSKKKRGLCARCSAKAVEGQIRCADCNKLDRKRYAVAYAKHKVDGECFACGQPAEDNSPLCRACKQKRKAMRLKVKCEVFDAYGGRRCVCCLTESIQFLTIEHPDMDGAEHRRKLGVKGGWQFYKKLKKLGFPRDYRLEVLCFNCNISRGFYGFCPHDLERAAKSATPAE
jgi:hypothetical protein